MNEIDPFFAWQFDPSSTCPRGCDRHRAGRNCRRSERRPGFCYQKGLTWTCRVSDVIKSYMIDSGISLKTLVS